MCSTRVKGQRGAPPTGNAGSCEFTFDFAPYNPPHPGEARGPAAYEVPQTRGSHRRVTSLAAPCATLALASLQNRKSAISKADS